MTQEDIIEFLKQRGKGTIKEMCKELDISQSSIARCCRKLVELGELTFTIQQLKDDYNRWIKFKVYSLKEIKVYKKEMFFIQGLKLSNSKKLREDMEKYNKNET